MSGNGKMPWFPFYVERFLGSRRVRRMTAEEVGVYVLLMAEQWDTGAVPDDDDELSFIGRASPETVRSILNDCFSLTDDGWANAVLEEIRQNQAEKLRLRKRAGKAGARARWRKG